MKIGSDKVTYSYFLGKLEVAKIVYSEDYGVTYNREENPSRLTPVQAVSSLGYLGFYGEEPIFIKSVQEGVSKLRELVGDKFVHLKVKKQEESDIKE